MKTSELESMIERVVRKVLMDEFVPKMLREAISGAVSVKLNEASREPAEPTKPSQAAAFRNIPRVKLNDEFRIGDVGNGSSLSDKKSVNSNDLLMQMLTPVDENKTRMGMSEGMKL